MRSTTPSRCAALLLTFALVLSTGPGPAAASEHKRYYKSGLSAAEAKDWRQVAEVMQQAIAAEPNESRRRLRRGTYFPHFYLGLARYHLGDCEQALASWSESENQGAIVGRPEFDQLLSLRRDCQDRGRPSAADGAAAAPPIDASAPTTQPKKTGKERVRSGQRAVEKGARPTRKALSLVERAAPAGSGLAEAARDGQEVVNAAEALTDLVDLAMPPPGELRGAVDAFFGGDPERTLELLAAIDTTDPRAHAQMYLFRAAASYRLHMLSGESGHLGRARESRGRFWQEPWQVDFPAEVFDPRFVRFMQAGE